MEYRCTRCGKTRTEEIPPFGHEWDDTENVSKQPTCTEPGRGDVVCSICGAINESHDIPALGHDFKIGKTIQPATCTEPGVYQLICKRCGYIEEDTIPPENHAFLDIVGRHVQKGEYDMETGKCITPTIIEIRCKKCGEIAERLVYDENLYE